MGFSFKGPSFLRKLSKKLSDDKDYDDFLKSYTNCTNATGRSREDLWNIGSQFKTLKKKAVQVIVLQDTAYQNKPAFIFDSFNPNKDFSKGSPSQCRFLSNGKHVDLVDIVFGNIPLTMSSDVKSSMKIHFLQDGEQIIITKILHGFRKQCSHTPTTSEFDPSSVLAATVAKLAAEELVRASWSQDLPPMTSSAYVNIPGAGGHSRSNRNHSLSQSPSSVADLQFWSTSPPTETPLTPSQHSRMSRSCRHSLHVKTRSLPSASQMNTVRVDHQSYGPRGPNCCGGGAGINLAICVVLTPTEAGNGDDSPTTPTSTSGTAADHQRVNYNSRLCSRFNAFLFKHFSQVETLIQGLEDRVTSVLSATGGSASGSSSSSGIGGSTTPSRSQIIAERVSRFQKAKQSFLEGLNDLLSTHRLHMPVWLSLTATDRDNAQRIPQHNLRHTFVRQCLVTIIAKLNSRDRAFFPSRLITGVLMHHLAWIPSVIPASGKLAKRCLMKHQPKWADSMPQSNPYNPHWAQLSDLYGGAGCSRMARTIIVGRNRSQVTSLLYFVSYFLRCANVTQTDERLPELGRADLYELQQARKVKLGNDSGISSQEDLAMNACFSASAGSSPTARPSLTLVDPGRLTSGQCRLAEAAAMAVVTFPDQCQGGVKMAPPQQLPPTGNNRPISPDSCRPGWNPWGGGNGTGNCTTGSANTANHVRSSTSPPCNQYVEIPLLFDNIICDEDEGHFSELDAAAIHNHHPLFTTTPFKGATTGANWPCPEGSLGHSMLAGVSSHYVNGFALQGTWQHESEFHSALVRDLRLALRQSSQDEPVDECSALVANVDDRTVQVVTVYRGSPGKPEITDVVASPLVASMLDTVRNLSDRNTCPKLCLQHLETRLQEIYFLGQSLADLLAAAGDQAESMEKSSLAGAVGVKEDDLPLLFHSSSCSAY